MVVKLREIHSMEIWKIIKLTDFMIPDNDYASDANE